MKRVLLSLLFYFPIILFLSGPARLIASNKPENLVRTNANNGFIENKGQIIDQNHNANPAVLYLLHTPGMNVQLTKAGFSYDLYSVGSRQSSVSSRQSAVGSQQSTVGKLKFRVTRHASRVTSFTASTSTS